MIRLLFIVNGFAIGGGELKVLELVRELRNDYPRQFIPFVCAIGQGGPLEIEFINMGIEPYIYH